VPCFVDDIYYEESKGLMRLTDFDPSQFEVMVTIADPYDRSRIVSRLPEQTCYFSFVHPTAVLLDPSTIEQLVGVFVGAFCVISTNVKVGSHVLFNRGSHVGHDCVLGDFVSLMPNTVVSGNVSIGNRCYLGSGAVVREKISICDGVTIGLNSGVVKHIDTPGVYVGTPVRKIGALL
jgi:sugar O-acyltransferase (sialic acid O-acetyltransferase NeuD family)